MKILTTDHIGLAKVISVQNGQVVTKVRLPPKRVPKHICRMGSRQNTFLVVNGGLSTLVIQGDQLSAEQNFDCEGEVVSVVQIGTTTILFQQNFGVKIYRDQQGFFVEDETSSFKMNGPKEGELLGAVLEPSNSQIAFFGKDFSPFIVEGTTGKQVWVARNVENDFLDLKQPKYDIAAFFIEAGNRLIIITRNGELREYRPKSGKRQPMLRHKFMEKEVPNAAKLVGQKILLVGSLMGVGLMLSLGPQPKVIGHLKGPKCSVLAVEGTNDFKYACFSYSNRFLRVFSLQSKACVKEINTSQKVTACIFLSESLDQQLLQDDQIEKEEQKALFKDPKVNRARLQQLKRYTVPLPYLQPRKLKKEQPQ